MPEPFKGVIKLDVRDSKPDWTPYTLKRAPAGAPRYRSWQISLRGRRRSSGA
jgi:hypothetical protein